MAPSAMKPMSLSLAHNLTRAKPTAVADVDDDVRGAGDRFHEGADDPVSVEPGQVCLRGLLGMPPRWKCADRIPFPLPAYSPSATENSKPGQKWGEWGVRDGTRNFAGTYTAHTTGPAIMTA